MIDAKARRILAAAAAFAVLDESPTFRSKGEQTRAQLLERAEVGTGEIDSRLEALVEAGYLRKRNTGRSGYGDSWIEGTAWSVTQAGLRYLWVGA